MRPIEYLVRVDPLRHQLHVELTIHDPPQPLRLSIPTWVPGAYGFLKYGRDLFDVEARDASGVPVSITREGWSSYVVHASSTVTVRYSAGAYDPAWGELAGLVDSHQAVLLGTRYLFVEGFDGPYRVMYELPEGWPLHHPAGARHIDAMTFEYPTYAALLDTPVTAGEFEVRSRTLHGVTFHHLFLDRTVGFEAKADAFIDAVMKVAEECHILFGSFPFERYTFIYTFNPQAHWGLEHVNATMIALEPNTLIDGAQWFDGVRVAAHELFHAWNVCRLKPVAMMKPDFTRGSFTDGLWVSEGFTRYYEFLLSVRAGEMMPEAFIANVVNYFRHLEVLPASKRVSAADSSYATFLNHNRYPGSVNSTIDYYDVGLLIAFDLDATARLESETDLDALFRAFYEAHRERGFTTADVKAFFGERVPALEELIAREVESAGQLGTVELLTRLGFETTFEEVRTLGLVLQENRGPVIANVLDTLPAGQCGLAAGDEIVSAGGYPFNLKALKWLVANGPEVELQVKRGARMLTFRAAPAPRRCLTGVRWAGNDAQLHRMRSWLGRPALVFPAGPLSLEPYFNFHGIQEVI